MKWNEAVFLALGEIDDDLIPADELNPAEKCPARRWIVGLGTAFTAILLIVGVILWPREQVDRNPTAARKPAGDPCRIQIKENLPNLAAYADEFTPIVRVHPLPALQDADTKPQIFAADDPEIIDPASFSPFLDQDGTTWTEK